MSKIDSGGKYFLSKKRLCKGCQYYEEAQFNKGP